MSVYFLWFSHHILKITKSRYPTCIMDQLDKGIDINGLNSLKGFKVVHFNIRSVHKKIDQLRVLLLNTVITLSETWLKPSLNSKLYDLDGFTLYRKDREHKGRKGKRGGGLLTYIHNKHTACSLPNNLDVSSKHIKGQWLKICRPPGKNVTVGNFYRPPSGDLKLAIDYMDDCMKIVQSDDDKIFLLGDFNVNFKNKSSPEFKSLDFFVKVNSLSQLITKPTRITNNSKSLIDLVMTNSKYISDSGTLDHFISDHQPVFAVKKKGRDHRPTVEFEGRSYRNFDRELFKTELLHDSWDDFYGMKDINKAWEHLLGRVEVILDKMCPLMKFKIKNYRPEWVTDELIEQIKDRDYFYHKAKCTNNEDYWNIAKHLRNTTNANIRAAKKDFIINELNENDSNCKKFWDNIRQVMPNDKGSSRQDILLKDDAKYVERSKVAQHINDYFINIGNPDSGVGLSGTGSVPNNQDNLWSVNPFTVSDVFKVVKV